MIEQRRWKILWATLSGLLVPLSFPRADLSFLAWVCLIPLFIAIQGAKPVTALLLGFLFGMISSAGKIYWMVETLVRYGGLSTLLSAVATVLVAGYLAIFPAMFSGILAWRRPRSPLAYAFFAAALWTALELAETYLFTGFPWELLGYSQYRQLSLIQFARFTGVYGVSFLIVLVNAMAAAMVLHLRRAMAGHRMQFQLLALTGVVLVLMMGAWLDGRRILQAPLPTDPKLKVAALQGNIEQDEKWEPEWLEQTLDIYERLTQQAVNQGATFIVMPETALPMYYRHPRYDRQRQKVEQWARQFNTTLLVGSLDYELGSATRILNTAFLISPAGSVIGKYDKIHLVPFGEYLPLPRIFGWLQALTEEVGSISPGREFNLLAVPNRHARPARGTKGANHLGARFGTLICYEIIFPDLTRRWVNAGADFLVTITNDAWFGKTSAPYQHFSMAVFRAVENGVYLIRAANTGISGVIHPHGVILRQTELFVPTMALAEIVVPETRPKTFYTRHGDLFSYLCAIGVAMVIATPLARTRRRAERHPSAKEVREGK